MRILLIPLFLSACASPNYEHYLATQQAITQSRSASESARFAALGAIAKNGDSAASVAAAMALALGGQSQPPSIAAPQNEFLQWAAILVPALGNAYAIGKSADVSIANSMMAASTAASTTNGFVSIAGKIQAPVVNQPQPIITTTTNTTNAMISSTGVLGDGQYSYDATHVPTVVTQPTPVVITQPTPVVGP